MPTRRPPETNKSHLPMNPLTIYDSLRKNNTFTEKQAKAQVKIMQNLATKDDLKDFATKFATKEDLKKFATKEDLKRFATKDDIKDMATKAYVKKELSALEHRIDNKMSTLERNMTSIMMTEFSSLRNTMLILFPTLIVSLFAAMIATMKLLQLA